MTIREAIQYGEQQLKSREDITEWAARDANLLLQHAASIPREQIFAWPEREITEQQLALYKQLIEKRLQAIPIQHLRGKQEFYGRDFLVTPDVLIPRPETELLIEEVKKHLAANTHARIVDVGTGSGIIAVTLAAELPSASVTAIDISPAALAVAQQNAERNNVAERIIFLESDLLEQFTATADVIVSNPPYIGMSERNTLHPQVREHEPALALFSGRDGNDIYERLIPQAWDRLRSGGRLLMELGTQGHSLDRLLQGWEEIAYVDDLQGIPRVVTAIKP